MSLLPVSPPTPQSRPGLWLVEDDDALRRALQLMLFNRGFDVRAFPSAAHALADAAADRIGVLVADYRLPDSDGVALLRALRGRGWAGHAVLLTGFPSPTLEREARAAGFAAVLEKPVPHHRLIAELQPPVTPAR
ncbi:response regulator [Sphingomonas suaedae]|uniref:Response regulator n=1 Tax=Sphingomonas suaedae TaxID=2599297 RepID=A0A518RIZ1_9SPHN|nr:response regulator [Sphingomonas suaedae]QDX27425.1 response regulator [Sphingomonas suaedae]